MIFGILIFDRSAELQTARAPVCRGRHTTVTIGVSPPLGTPSPRVQTYPCPTLGDVLSGRGIAAHFSSSHNGGGDDEVDTVGVALLRKQAKAALARTQAAKGGDSSGSAKAEPELNETLARVDGLAQRKRKAAESHADIDIMPWHRCMPATSSENGSDSLEKAVTSLSPLRRRRSGDVEETGRVFSIDDRQPGKTAVGIDIILSWKLRNDGPGESKKLCCIYIAVGQKPFTVIQLVQVLKKNDAVKYTSIFAATATEATFLQ
ncbi:unnamed protein product [Tilletia controversa]|nr:unnamed protein product [Tilletia controversa]